jgi:hypothetical protein
MIVKARVELLEDHATVHDVMNGAQLAVFTGVPRPAGRDRWRVGEATIIATEPGCLCGGTVVKPAGKPAQRQWVPRRAARRV